MIFQVVLSTCLNARKIINAFRLNRVFAEELFAVILLLLEI